MEPSATSSMITGPVRERLQAALKTHLFLTARRHGDVFMNLAPYINIKTYLLKLPYHLGRRGIVLPRQITVLTYFKDSSEILWVTCVCNVVTLNTGIDDPTSKCKQCILT